MKTDELFESLQDKITKAIDMAEEHPDVINWDQEPQDYDSYEEALEDATFVILNIDDMDIRHERQADLIQLVHKMVRRRALGQKRRGK